MDIQGDFPIGIERNQIMESKIYIYRKPKGVERLIPVIKSKSGCLT